MTKIATCNYCGRRTMLQPTARGGHELACASCGAPLHEMKSVKIGRDAGPRKRASGPVPGVSHPDPHRARARPGGGPRPRPPRRPPDRPARRRKPRWKKALEEAFDLIEDIFD